MHVASPTEYDIADKQAPKISTKYNQDINDYGIRRVLHFLFLRKLVFGGWWPPDQLK